MKTDRSDFFAMVGAMGMAGMARWWQEFSHRHGFCKCHRLYFIETPCVIRLEELAEEHRQWLWSQWDGLGLGYIGPRLVNGKEA